MSIPRSVRALVLSANYEVIGCVGWQRAIELLFRGKVDVLVEYEEHQVRSPSLTINLPSVIRYREGHKYRKLQLRFSRENIYIRDGGVCQYCGVTVSKKTFTIDHVIPKRYGGAKSWDNIVTCCGRCNARKGDLSPEEAGLRLRNVPKKPSQINEFLRLSISVGGFIPEAWKMFIGSR